MLNDLAEAMKALDGKKSTCGFVTVHNLEWLTIGHGVFPAADWSGLHLFRVYETRTNHLVEPL